MLYSRHTKFLSPVLIAALLILFSTPQGVFSSAADEGVRADLPPGGEISIVNPRGSVHIEVWEEPHVSIAVAVKGEKLKRSSRSRYDNSARM